MTRRGKILVLAAFLVVCAAVLLLLARTGDEWALSKESGFYDEPFYLTIKAPSDEIYYTVDGSEPDRDSLRYAEPIYIYDATSDPNVYSNIKDVSLFYDEGLKKLFLEHRLDGGITNVVPDYVSPEYNVSKCRVIRAVYYDEEGKKSDVLTGSYFVGADTEGAADRRGGGESEASGKAGEGGVSEDDKGGMTVSLIMEPEDLFGYERGICVMGERMEEFMRDAMSGREHDGGDADDDERDEDADDGDDDDGEYGGDEDDPLSGLWEANYTGRGPEWERRSTVQFFREGRLVTSQEAGIRIKGGYSREYDPKSLNLFARSEYDGNTTFDLGESPKQRPDKLTLYNGGEDIYSKLKDPLIADLCSGMNFATMSFTPCDLYINGEYWGYYFLTDKYDKRYIENKYQVDDDNVVMIKDNLTEEGTESDESAYLEDMLFISSADMTSDENYRKACRIMDMESFIDYMAAEIYIARWLDWPGTNFAMWKTRKADNGEYGDCRWRMMLFDVNWGGMSCKDGDVERDTIAWSRGQSPIFDNLLNNDGFRQAFTDRLLSLGENEFAPEKVDEKIDELVGIMDNPMDRHYRRFFGTDDARFHEEAEELRRFFRERRDFIPEMIAANFE